MSDEERDGELRHAQLQTFYFKGLSLAAVLLEESELIDILYLRQQSIVGGNLCEGIVLVTQRGIEIPAHLVQELFNRLVAYFRSDCQRIDEHTRRMVDAQVGAPVADGRDAQLLGRGKARQRIEYCREQQMSRRDVVGTTEAVDSVDVKPCRHLADSPLHGV